MRKQKNFVRRDDRMTTQNLAEAIKKTAAAIKLADQQLRQIDDFLDRRIKKGLNEIQDNDLAIFSELATLCSSLSFGNFRYLNTYMRRRIIEFINWAVSNLPEEVDDSAIYSLYHFATACRNDVSLNSGAAISRAICRYLERDTSSGIVFKDAFDCWARMFSHRVRLPKGLPKGAIETDDVAAFQIGMTLNGKETSIALIRHLIATEKINILEHIIRNDRRLNKAISPDKLLLLVLSESRPSYVLKIISAIEERYPGTVKMAADYSGHNAHWFAIRFYQSYGCKDDADAIGDFLAEKGCDPDRNFPEGFSWNTVKRIAHAIDRFEHKNEDGLWCSPLMPIN